MQAVVDCRGGGRFVRGRDRWQGIGNAVRGQLRRTRNARERPRALREPGLFELVQADHRTVSWPGGIDLDPDSVYLESVSFAQSAVA